MSHTPGPWKATEDGFIYQEDKSAPFKIENIKENRYDYIGDWITFKPGTDDSNLVCAAPDLLEAAKKTLKFLDLHTEITFTESRECFALLQKAINKAEGKK